LLLVFFSLFTRCYERRLSSGSGRWSSCWASRVQVTASPSLALQADTATEHDVICSPFAQKRSVPSSSHAPPISPHQRRASSFGARKLTLRDDAFSQYIKLSRSRKTPHPARRRCMKIAVRKRSLGRLYRIRHGILVVECLFYHNY